VLILRPTDGTSLKKKKRVLLLRPTDGADLGLQKSIFLPVTGVISI
jgi:hypothetical protein